MGKSAGSPPEGVNYERLIPLQTQANKDMFNYSLGQSRVNQVTPQGTQTWSSRPTFDSAGYGAAYDRWAQTQPTRPGTMPTPAPIEPYMRAGMPDGRMGILMSGGDPGADGTGGTGTPGDGAPGGPGDAPAGPSDPGGGPSGPGDPGGGAGGPSDPYNPQPVGAPGSPTNPWTGVAPSRNDFMNREWTLTTQLSPEQQQLYDLTTAGQTSQQRIANALQEQAGGALGTPFSPAGLPARAGQLSAGPQGGVFSPNVRAGALPNAPADFSSRYASPGAYQGGGIDPRVMNDSLSPSGAVQAPGAQVQNRSPGLDFELQLLRQRLGELDPMEFGMQASDALYSQARRYFEPQQQEEQRALEGRLAEQGFVPGTPAYTQAMDEFRRANERTRGDARDRAVSMGASVGNQAFGNRLGSIQSQIASLMSGANFGLANDQSRAGEGLDLARFMQSEGSRGFGEQRQAAEFAQGQNQGNFSRELAGVQEGRAGQAQGFNQGQTAAEFQLGQDTAGFQRRQQIADFLSRMQGQDFGQQVTQQGLGRQATLDANDVSRQLFDREVTAGGFNNTNRQQALAEALALRTQPLNELNSFRTGAQWQMPNFGSPQTGSPGLGAPDVLGAANQDYMGKLNAYNARVGSSNANTNAMAQIAMALMGMF